MSLTGAHISTALKSAGAGWGLVMSDDAIAAAFNDAILRYGQGQFGTVDRVAALVSECMMESAYFRTTEEYNKTKGAYQPYRGRTFIQITWRSNYDLFGVWCRSKGLVASSDYFTKDPVRLADLKWAAIGGVWYFTQVMFHGKPLTEYSSNIEQVGKAVNLGDPFSTHTLSSLAVRRKAFDAVRALGSDIIPAPPTPDIPDLEENLMAMTPAERKAFANEIADAILARDAVPDTFTGNKDNPTVATKTALASMGDSLAKIRAKLGVK